MKFSHSRSGISLIEIAIIVTIVGVMGGLAFSVGKTQLDVAYLKGSDNNLESLKNALILYHKKMGRYPCPAKLADASTVASYGIEQTGCDTTCPAGIVCNNNAAIGFVPFKTIGINEATAYDGWGRRVSYVVDIQHTASSAYASGTIPIIDGSNNPVTASNAFGSAIFTLISHGPDGKGAYNKSGGLYSACNTTSPSLDAENCDGDDTFRDMRMSDSDVVTKFSDDQVIWHTQDEVPESSNENNEVCLADALSARTEKMSIGEYSSCYIGNNGRIYCWGNGNYGALAQGGGAAASKVPIAITGGINDWISVSVGWRNICGLRSNGHLYCWGRNWYGQVGDGTFTAPNGPAGVGVHSPTEVVGASCAWKQVSAGAARACGIKTDGRLYCWGRTSTTDVLEPAEVPGEHNDWIFVDVNGSDTYGVCGIRGAGASGNAYCFGFNGQGQLGNGSFTDSDIPVQVKDTAGTGAYNDWILVRGESSYAGSGAGTNCGIRANGAAYCWGSNNNGELGNNTSGTDSNLPKQVRDTAGTGYWTDWTFIEGSVSHSCGVRSNGRGYCWGSNTEGQLGIGVVGGADRTTPQEVSGAFTNWTTIDPYYGGVATCGVRNNALYCWGNSWTSGLLGGNQPDSTSYSTPQAVTMPVPLP